MSNASGTTGFASPGNEANDAAPHDATVKVGVVRVFTNETGAFGNELGVVWSSETTRGREQAIARKLGFSETVFIDELVEGDDTEDPDDRTASIRIFTPAGELPFAGHPSVGTAWYLADRGTPVRALVEKAGTVAVRYDGELTWITGEADWAPEFEWVPLDTPHDVETLDPAAYSNGHYYAWAWYNEEAGRMRSRMFAPEMGIFEDEATGGAAVRITAILGRDLEIEQGRGSLISTRLGDGDSVHVGGRTVADRDHTVKLSELDL